MNERITPLKTLLKKYKEGDWVYIHKERRGNIFWSDIMLEEIAGRKWSIAKIENNSIGIKTNQGERTYVWFFDLKDIDEKRMKLEKIIEILK